VEAIYAVEGRVKGVARFSSAFIQLRVTTDELCRLYSVSILIDTRGGELFLLVTYLSIYDLCIKQLSLLQ
jgi:hypothetical protein